MIKQPAQDNLKLVIGSISIFAAGFILKIDPVIWLFLVSILCYLNLSRKFSDIKSFSLLNLTFLFTIIITISYFIIKRGVPVLFIPFCMIPIASVLLFSELRITLLLTLVSAITIASIAGNNFYLVLLFTISGVLSAVLVYGARKRSEIIRAGVLTGLIQSITFLFIQNFQIKNPESYIILILNGLGCSIIVIGILPVFEYLFKTVTNISLLELADFNHPLMQRMTLEAPGTYHHSLVVGNLSDAACKAIGANSLLARIGAYYHDIGKLSKPEYFSENQGVDLKASKHENLVPTMSKLVIMNHVKEGVELAKKYKLNPRLVDFIEEHHGNSLVYYFYRRALENSHIEEEVSEEGFRYPGPKPKTKEAAVVLLADSAEAATRTLKEHTPGKIKETVSKVINNKFIDAQLDECDLTLRDLEKIATVFIRILSGIYHSRITYPDSSK